MSQENVEGAREAYDALGLAVEASWIHVLTARDNKAVRIEWYGSRGDALEAAGLRD